MAARIPDRQTTIQVVSGSRLATRPGRSPRKMVVEPGMVPVAPLGRLADIEDAHPVRAGESLIDVVDGGHGQGPQRAT